MRVPSVTAVIDLQFGSTGKGSIAAWLGEYGDFDAVAHAWGPNAGHTSVYNRPNGMDPIVCVRTMLSNAAFRSPTIKKAFVGPGSMVNVMALLDELDDTHGRGNPDLQLFIHESAAVVLPMDVEAEKQYGFAIGSTMKGTGEAVMRKLRRQVIEGKPATMGDYAKALPTHPISQYVVSHQAYLGELYSCNRVLAEGCQGYSLGVNSGFWPHTTSRECTVPQLLSDLLLPIHSVEDVIGVARTYPIRVANRFDAQGNMIGTSGPCYADQREIQWADIGREPELTTVTKLPRRIFTFSMQQIVEAVVRNSVNTVFLNFLNYLPPSKQAELMGELSAALPRGCSVDFTGYGPAITDIEAGREWGEIKKAVDAERAAVATEG